MVSALGYLHDLMRKIATLISEYRPNSHADVIVGRVLGGYYYNGAHHDSSVDVVSMFTDQVPDLDMSRDLAREHGFKLLPSIRHALTMISDQSFGPRDLAVDGVLLICEHGAYPYNPLGQKLYPRFEFFKAMIDVFRETGQTAPVFLDKHLSWDWHKARWMYDQAQELGFPFMAGSVIPLARHPDLRWPWQQPMTHAVQLWHADFVDNKESYGFHALEELQSMVERRSGCETGVAAVTCLAGESVWGWTEANSWATCLLESVSGTDMETVRATVADPLVFVVEYVDGLQAAVYRINGLEYTSSFAALSEPSAAPIVTPATAATPRPDHLPADVKDRYPVANHFAAEVHLFERMVDSGRVEHPVERTLLTTGVLAALHESSYRPSPMYGRTMQHGKITEEGRRVQTPHLQFGYSPQEQTGSTEGVA